MDPATGALLGAGAAGLLTGGIGALAGGEQKLNQSAIGMMRGAVNAGGLRSALHDENRTVAITSSPERQALVRQLSKQFSGAAGELGVMRGQLKPGFGAISQARRQQIQAAERQALGDLRSGLSRRRVLGSSFASDAEAAVRDRFGRALSEADAQSWLEEFEANLNLFGQQTAMASRAFETQLSELNLQASLAQGILASSSEALGRLASVNAAASADWNTNMLSLGVASASLLGQGGGSLIGTPNKPQVSGWRETLA